MSDMKITPKEFESYGINHRTLSDMDYSLNSETGKWDIPSLEWSDYMGEFWSRYDSEEARTEALNEYEMDMEMWVKIERTKLKFKEEMKIKKSKEIKEMKTLGGQFPELHSLQVKLNKLKSM